MIKTYEEFSEVLDRRYRELKPIKWKYPYLLSEEGKKTANAYSDLINEAQYHDYLKEFANDKDVLKILEQYKDCNQVSLIASFLKKQIGNSN